MKREMRLTLPETVHIQQQELITFVWHCWTHTVANCRSGKSFWLKCYSSRPEIPITPPPPFLTRTITTPPLPNTVPLDKFIKGLYSPSCVLCLKTLSVWCGLCLWKALEDIPWQIPDTHLQRTKQGNTAKLSGHTSSTGDCCNPRDKPQNTLEPYHNWTPICTPTTRKWLRV